MVVKIQKSSSKMKHVIDYNERKVEDMEASVIDYHLIQSPDRKTIEKAFERYEKANFATQNVSFHMSINPSPSDNMDEEQIKSLAAEILDELGYKDQPYVIYKHEDIERTHYHVVSIRVNELGRKIKDFKEAYKCQKILEKLSQKYGYTIGKATEEHIIDVEEENKKKHNKNPDQPEKITTFDPRAEVTSQYKTIFDECLGYHFTTWPQFREILLAHGIIAQLEGPEENQVISLQGTDNNGKAACNPVTETELGIPLYEKCLERASKCKSDICKIEKDRIKKIISSCKDTVKDEDSFRKELAKEGIHLILAIGKDGNIFGTTYIDHVTKCAFKASELGKGHSINDILTNPTTNKKPSKTSTKTTSTGQIKPVKGSQDPNTSKEEKSNSRMAIETLIRAAEILTAEVYHGKAVGKDESDDPRKKKRRRKKAKR